MKKPGRVREPVQVYLDRDDRALLADAARVTGLPQAEILRRGLRRLAGELLAESRPGAALETLIGSLGEGSGAPPDLAERHDEYLYPPESDSHARRG